MLINKIWHLNSLWIWQQIIRFFFCYLLGFDKIKNEKFPHPFEKQMEVFKWECIEVKFYAIIDRREYGDRIFEHIFEQKSLFYDS